ncbi:MAG: ParB/RepB/Spo0J family partition protein [Methylococcales bacterium]|jgi:ParB family transcriptional regulator, chromosome partitioning protein|nr:ParB/RepB/Spo0J family partition protein [Methylococcales bacterium]MBT7445760.1 ParB/RepB/Spo0J family partition protein [Methylococcales bacterium]
MSFFTDMKAEATSTNIPELVEAVVDEPLAEFDMLAIKRIRRSPFQYRTHIDDHYIEEMAKSCLQVDPTTKEQMGIVQPIIVRRDGNDFELISGECRWLAAQKAGLSHIPARITEYSDTQSLLAGVIENFHRQNPPAIDQANVAQKLQQQLRLPNMKIAMLLNLGKSKSVVSNLLKLLKLPNPVQQLLNENPALFPKTHAQILLEFKLTEAEMITLANQVIENGWSSRELHRRCTALTATDEKEAPAANPVSLWAKKDQKILAKYSEQTSLKVSVKQNGEKTAVTLHCANKEELKVLLKSFNEMA